MATGRAAKLSAGILLYRRASSAIVEPSADSLEVLLVHPGGPFWARKDEGAWSIPKGEYEPPEDAFAAATREFGEELGSAAPTGRAIELGTVKLTSGKVVMAWALEGDLDASTAVSNSFELEWPRGSGRIASFPEVDRAEWFSIESARPKVNRAQMAFLDRLIEAFRGIHDECNPTSQRPS
jgi:predicted NUDIX family NTP pyrophosphohydrolase